MRFLEGHTREANPILPCYLIWAMTVKEKIDDIRLGEMPDMKIVN